jgi:hypothetical protein
MIVMHRLSITILCCLLSGCTSQLLEDVAEVGQLGAPRPCTEPTKLFGTFTMRASKATWKGDKSDATLTLELVFNNDKNFPVALTNSGNGVLYSVEFKLQGEKENSFAPKEAGGVALMREPNKFKEPRHPGVFGYPTRPKQPGKNTDSPLRDLNFRIKPGEPETGKLVFHAPRGNYLFVIERKFDGKPTGGQPADHLAVCRISAGAAANGGAPAGAAATPGLY